MKKSNQGLSYLIWWGGDSLSYSNTGDSQLDHGSGWFQRYKPFELELVVGIYALIYASFLTANAKEKVSYAICDLGFVYYFKQN